MVEFVIALILAAPAQHTVTVSNQGSSSRWLSISEIEVFPQGVQPDTADAPSSNRIISGVAYSYALGTVWDDFSSGVSLVNGVAAEKGWALGSASGNSVTLTVDSSLSVGVVRVWQRDAGHGCCLTRLAGIDVTLTVDGVSTVTGYAGQPVAYAEVNFGPELFSWSAPAFACQTTCGLAAYSITRIVGCIGDAGTSSADSDCTFTKPTTTSICPATGCCTPAPHTLYVAADGDAEASGCEATAPMRTINACIAAAGTGDTCVVFPGRYLETVSQVYGVANLTLVVATAAQVASAGRSGTEALIDGTVPVPAEWAELTDANEEVCDAIFCTLPLGHILVAPQLA